MPFLTGLAITALAPFQAAQSFAFAADARLDALGWAGLAAVMAVVAVLGRTLLRAARAKRRRREAARRAALADPRRRWLAPSASFNSAPQAVAPEPVPAAMPIPGPEVAQEPFAAPEPTKPANSQNELREPKGGLREVPQELPPTREQLFVRAMRVPVKLVPLPKHVQQARLAGLMAPPPVAAPEAQPQTLRVSAPQAPPVVPKPAAQAVPISAPEAVSEPIPQALPPKRTPLYAELRAPVVPVPLPKHVVEARLAGLMAPPLAAPAPTPQPPQPKSAYVPASPTFAGGHVLASGLDARVFLRYRDAAGAVTDSIFQLYQVRAAWQGGRIAQLHGYCFTLRACQVIAMQDVHALGDERTGNFIFDLDAFLLGTLVPPNPFGITLSPRGEYLRDPDLPLLELPADWLEWQSLTDQQAYLAQSGTVTRANRRRDPADAGARFLLRYVGSDARASDRVVRLTSISLGDDGTILSLNAHCERAGAARMFRRDRIAGLGDAATGALHADIDAALRRSGAKVRRSGAAAAEAGGPVERFSGRGGFEALEEARRLFAEMAPDERLASATRPPEPTLPKEKRPRGRPRKNAVKPDE